MNAAGSVVLVDLEEVHINEMLDSRLNLFGFDVGKAAHTRETLRHEFVVVKRLVAFHQREEGGIDGELAVRLRLVFLDFRIEERLW